ncbi:MAG: hypothetical protein R3E65_10345 [Steroidobacteraceae bacterium]
MPATRAPRSVSRPLTFSTLPAIALSGPISMAPLTVSTLPRICTALPTRMLPLTVSSDCARTPSAALMLPTARHR